jgi:hypothetical protein
MPNVIKLFCLQFTNLIVCETKLEKLAKDKHSSLLQKFVNYGLKGFRTLAPGRDFARAK